jgi:hypothetical protein
VLLADDRPTPPPVKEPKLRTELLSRSGTDQEARRALIRWMQANGSNGVVPADLPKEKKDEHDKLSATLKEVDANNTKWLKSVIEKHGWPTNSLVGKDAANAAWLLVQHADADPKFQRQCLDLMAKAPKDEVSQTNLAYLTDRVLLAEGKKQLYATQLTSADGKWVPRPLEDAANVDKRRSEVGLPPLDEYIKGMERLYGGAKKK